jgi:LysM repeat protein
LHQPEGSSKNDPGWRQDPGRQKIIADKLRAPEPKPEKKAGIYEIVSDDTLGEIAKRYYGNVSR